MAVVRRTPLEPMVGDPDDHRPETRWRLVVDPAGDGAGRPVAGLAFLEERCAVGARIPLHRHDVDEVVVIVDGSGTYRLDGEEVTVGPGDVVFIPAGSAHGTVNTGPKPLHLHAVFPARQVVMEMLERNPAPGTEGAAPSTTRYDFATGAFEPVEPSGPSPDPPPPPDRIIATPPS